MLSILRLLFESERVHDAFSRENLRNSTLGQIFFIRTNIRARRQSRTSNNFLYNSKLLRPGCLTSRGVWLKSLTLTLEKGRRMGRGWVKREEKHLC